MGGLSTKQFSVPGRELGSGTAVTCMFKLDKEWLLFYLLIPRCYVEIKRPRIGVGVIKEPKTSGQSGRGPCRWSIQTVKWMRREADLLIAVDKHQVSLHANGGLRI